MRYCSEMKHNEFIDNIHIYTWAGVWHELVAVCFQQQVGVSRLIGVSQCRSVLVGVGRSAYLYEVT